MPLRAVIQNTKGEKIVRVMDSNNKISDVVVTTGLEGTDGNVEVMSGIKEGDTVVVLVKN